MKKFLNFGNSEIQYIHIQSWINMGMFQFVQLFLELSEKETKNDEMTATLDHFLEINCHSTTFLSLLSENKN